MFDHFFAPINWHGAKMRHQIQYWVKCELCSPRKFSLSIQNVLTFYHIFPSTFLIGQIFVKLWRTSSQIIGIPQMKYLRFFPK